MAGWDALQGACGENRPRRTERQSRLVGLLPADRRTIRTERSKGIIVKGALKLDFGFDVLTHSMEHEPLRAGQILRELLTLVTLAWFRQGGWLNRRSQPTLKGRTIQTSIQSPKPGRTECPHLVARRTNPVVATATESAIRR